MSDLNVAELLQSMREHGTIDSQGEFTISLSEARRKLTQFGSSNRARYLLLFLSAGIGAGAQVVSIARQQPSYVLTMPGAYIPESALLSAIRGQSDSGLPCAADLGLGLRTALALGARSIELSLRHPQQPSFHWTLSSEGQTSEPLDPGDTAMEVRVLFPASWQDRLGGLLSRFRGYASLPEELRLVEQFCDHCDVPIEIAGTPVNRPIFLPPAIVYAQVGENRGGTFFERPPLVLDLDRGWRGQLSLGEGPTWLVVNGLTMGQLEDDGLAGVVYHDSLKLDLARENLVQDETYDALLDDLARVRLALLEQVTHRLAESNRSVHVGLLETGLSQQLSDEGCHRYLCWLAPDQVSTEPGQARWQLPLCLARRGLSKVAEQATIGVSARAFKLRASYLVPISRVVLQLLKEIDPAQTLVPGYVLLGLGAYASWKGDQSLANKTWMEALDTVRAGQDDLAEELIHAHMDFPVEHIMDQVAIALTRYLSTPRED